ncbi:MAG: hypothetical protein Fur0032_09610 [Terrimicrobiaceae bacterium]
MHSLRSGLSPAILVLLGALFLSGCSGPSPDATISSTRQGTAEPLDARLAKFASLHASRDVDRLAEFFMAGARLTSPVMARPSGPAEYASSLLANPFNMEVSNTRILYANQMGAKTRSSVRVSAPARFSVADQLDVRWKYDGGRWKIQEIDYVNWSPVIGNWRRAGQRGEPSIELRILPGGTYLVYADRDRSVPTFRGSYVLEAGMIRLTDTSAANAADLDRSEGRYVFFVTPTSLELRKSSDDNRWRAERFEGIWSPGS